MTYTMIVEDDADTRAIIQLALNDAGCPTLEATDGIQALAIARDNPQPLIILLDIGLPQLDGLDVLRQITQQPVTYQRAYILMTAYTPTKYAEINDILTQLQVQVLNKPFDMDVLVSTVQQAETTLASSQ